MEEPAAVDLEGQRVEDANFAQAHLHAPNFHSVRITDGWFRDADISGDVGGLRVNGVLIEPLVEAELDRREPERVMLRAGEQRGLLGAVDMLDARWSQTVTRARRLPAPLLDERVDGEWSFIETLRHLILASDSWLGRMVNGEAMPYHPWGLAGSFLTDPASLGLDYDARPSLDDVLEVRAARALALRSAVASTPDRGLSRPCVPPDDGGHPSETRSVLECLHVILNEEWEHGNYANRDLTILEGRLTTEA